MTENVKIKAFPMVFGQNGCVHRVLRSILSQKRPGRSSRRRLDFVETSPRSLGFTVFFCDFSVIFGYGPACERVKHNDDIGMFQVDPAN